MKAILKMIELAEAGLIKIPETNDELVSLLKNGVDTLPARNFSHRKEMSHEAAIERMAAIVRSATEDWVFESTVIQRVAKNAASRQAGVDSDTAREYINTLVEHGAIYRDGMKIKRNGETK